MHTFELCKYENEHPPRNLWLWQDMYEIHETKQTWKCFGGFLDGLREHLGGSHSYANLTDVENWGALQDYNRQPSCRKKLAEC